MSDSVVITYSGQQVSVPKEVADFLEQDRKREQAQEKQDKRHLSKSEFETVLSGSDCVRRPVEDTVLRNLQLETLRKAVDGLGDQGRDLVELRYGRGLTMEEIGTIYGVSKAAVLKRLKKPAVVSKNFSDQLNRTRNEQEQAKNRPYRNEVSAALRGAPHGDTRTR